MGNALRYGPHDMKWERSIPPEGERPRRPGLRLRSSRALSSSEHHGPSVLNGREVAAHMIASERRELGKPTAR